MEDIPKEVVMIVGNVKIQQRAPAMRGMKTEYRVWETVVDSDPFTGKTMNKQHFHGTFNDPKALFRRLVELSITVK